MKTTQALTIVLVAAWLPACSSMPTKQRRAREAAEIGLTSHPEFAELRLTLARLEALIETLSQRITALDEGRAADREGQRDDLEKVMEYLTRQVDDVKAALTKERR